jgi:threonine/homoserine/homoserine lactone efflux protein
MRVDSRQGNPVALPPATVPVAPRIANGTSYQRACRDGREPHAGQLAVMGHLLPCLAVAAMVIITPGPDTALTIRNALIGGRRDGILTGGGVATGQAVWALATGVWLAALLQAFQPAYVAIKLVGAAYLIYLGAHSLPTALRIPERKREGSRPRGSRSASKSFRQGILSNLGNPKMAVFFLSLLPQFVPSGANTFPDLLLLGLTFCLMTFIWLTGYSIAVAKFGDVLRGSRVRRALDALTGAALIGLGLRVATEGR